MLTLEALIACFHTAPDRDNPPRTNLLCNRRLWDGRTGKYVHAFRGHVGAALREPKVQSSTAQLRSVFQNVGMPSDQ